MSTNGKATRAADVAEIEGRQDELRTRARALLGVTGEGSDIPPLREVGGLAPVISVGALAAVDAAQTVVVLNSSPDISSALGVSGTAVVLIVFLKTVAFMAAALPAAAYVQHRPRRAMLARVAAVVTGVAAVGAGLALTAGGLLLALVVSGAASGAALAVHTPLLADVYPPAARVRALAAHRSAVSLGFVVAVLAVVAPAALGFTWRGALVASGLVCFVAAAGARGLLDPGFGVHDAARVRDEVWRAAGAQPEDDGDAGLGLGFFEGMRRLMAVATVRRVLLANVFIGMMLFPLQSYLAYLLDDRWGMSVAGQSVFVTAIFVVVAVGLVVAAPHGERLHREDPARLVHVTAALLIAVVGLLVVGVVVPFSPVAFVAFAGVFAVIAATAPALLAVVFTAVPARLRAHAAVLSGITLLGAGRIGGVLLLSGLDRRFGLSVAIVCLSLPAVAAGLVLRAAAANVGGDIDRVVDEIVEGEEIAIIQREGRHLPMLSCRHIDFSYGQLQVLFDVSFTVDDGEMVALLGTNGAGKSTLLRVISGLGLPSRGSVTFRGSDITFLDAERRLDLGITQIPGGKATFPPLSVVENLRVFGHSLGRDTKAVDAGIDATLDAFPRLAERRNQLAATLSGGEQQMLALGKAFIVKPQLLLIDELSLGLAPKIVGELLEMVRRINETGTAVVLVEQSVNIALSLVDHAYFMEKGEMRFDGRASELLERRDLLRSVFLEGATKGLG